MSIRAADPARSRVVLLGASQFDDPGLEDVPAVRNNIADLAKLLRSPDLGGFDDRTCVVAPEHGTIDDIGRALSVAAAEAEDLLLFYYAGHGVLGPRRADLYLTLPRTRINEMQFTAISFDSIRDVWLGSAAKNSVIILDCCFSGQAIGSPLSSTDSAVFEQLEVSGTYTLASAPPNRPAMYLDGERHTAFTGRLLEWLSAGDADLGPYITMEDVYRRLRRQMRAEGLPEPQKRTTATTDLLGIFRNQCQPIPAEPEPADPSDSDPAFFQDYPEPGPTTNRIGKRWTEGYAAGQVWAERLGHATDRLRTQRFHVAPDGVVTDTADSSPAVQPRPPGLPSNLEFALMALVGLMVPGALGWLFGGHGIHMFQGRLGGGNLIPLVLMSTVAFSLFAVPMFGLGLAEDSVSPASLAGGVFGTAAFFSAILHWTAPGTARHLLGIEHMAQITRDWLVWHF